ncbi:MAG: zf-HC2 domain-containing protein [Marinobacter sp.]|nr:zf-HC2 domain-containing protein [Marinobacter sp.]
MLCHECQAQFIAYLNQTMTAPERADLERHLDDCGDCRARLSRERSFLHALKQAAPVPEPSQGFEARVLAAAIPGQRRQSWSSPWVGAAVAAALILGVVLGAGLFASAPRTPVVTSNETSGPAASGVSEAPTAPMLRTVKLAFSSHDALDNVTLTLDLPKNVELARFPGRQTLSWKVDLKAGDNVLALPIRVLFPGSGDLVAHLDDGVRQKTFRVRLPDSDPARSPSS